ncbi:hypothetical protein H6G00_01755 [Leptolyngbya sp. FACHB-541]|uniref:hypothetical protein n=1 Tax=Leptolyngbya sp. FACHB-541 TaxID=2692810 RepID=UPI0016829C4C|nr:hypothetical protein [Leptolyngbya sp. FACHB-541]MBD1995356.1 hypothetical protein [Leptolyngbya sp. FACHB-541]
MGLRNQIISHLSLSDEGGISDARAEWLERVIEEYSKILQNAQENIDPAILERAMFYAVWGDKCKSFPVLPPPSEPVNYRELTWFDCVANDQIYNFFQEITCNFEYVHPTESEIKRMIHMLFVTFRALDLVHENGHDEDLMWCSSVLFHEWMSNALDMEEYDQFRRKLLSELMPFISDDGKQLDKLMKELLPASHGNIDPIVASIHPDGWEYVDRYRLELIELAAKKEGLKHTILYLENLNHPHGGFFPELSPFCDL